MKKLYIYIRSLLKADNMGVIDLANNDDKGNDYVKISPSQDHCL